MRADSFLEDPSRFEEVEPIAAGSQSVVFRARRKSDGKWIAAKRVRLLGRRAAAVLDNEVNALIRLRDHPNVVRYCGHLVDLARSEVFILTEFCKRGDLGDALLQLVDRRDRLQKKQLLSETRFWNWAFDVALALHACHASDPPLIHRDVKPANVLLSDGGVAKLADFGLACDPETARQQLAEGEDLGLGVVVGTPAYTAPEGARDAKSDSWSFGCLLLEMCSLEPPPPFLAAAAAEEQGRRPRSSRRRPLPQLIRETVERRVPFPSFSTAVRESIAGFLRPNPEERTSVTDWLLDSQNVRR